MKRYKSIFREAYNPYSEVVDTISRNTAINIRVVLTWLKKYYSNKEDVIDMMTAFASSKKWKVLAKSILNDKKL